MTAAANSADLDAMASRQRSCAEATSSALSTADGLIDQACSRLQSGESPDAVLAQLNEELQAAKLSKSVSTATQHFHEAVKTFAKVLFFFLHAKRPLLPKHWHWLSCSERHVHSPSSGHTKNVQTAAHTFASAM